MKQTAKDFDCVEMKRRLQERIREATRGMDTAEREAWLRREIAASRFAGFLDRPASAARGRVKRDGPEA